MQEREGEIQCQSNYRVNSVHRPRTIRDHSIGNTEGSNLKEVKGKGGRVVEVLTRIEGQNILKSKEELLLSSKTPSFDNNTLQILIQNTILLRLVG